jgi:hypothetical protein
MDQPPLHITTDFGEIASLYRQRRGNTAACHCEEQRDEAISVKRVGIRPSLSNANECGAAGWRFR